MSDKKEDFFESKVVKYQFSKQKSKNSLMIAELSILTGIALVLYLLTKLGGN